MGLSSSPATLDATDDRGGRRREKPTGDGRAGHDGSTTADRPLEAPRVAKGAAPVGAARANPPARPRRDPDRALIAARRVGLALRLKRIDGSPTLADLEVEVRAGAPTRAPDARDDLALPHVLADPHRAG